MTDRELLESAAKAAGMVGYAYCEPWNAMARTNSLGEFFGRSWNPLMDDGDALRLAVALKIELFPIGNAVQAMADGGPIKTEVIFTDTDPCASTRRAIVRAAAALEAEGAR